MKIKFFTILLFFINSVAVATEENNVQSECVGRLTFNIPYPAEIASASYEEAKKQISHPNFNPKYSFSDGETTWSNQIFYLGPIFVSNGLTSKQMDSMKKNFSDERKKTVEFFKKIQLRATEKLAMS